MNSETTYQIQRIKKKLLLAKEIDKDLEVFGADSHVYVLSETAAVDDIFEFEKKYNVSLPDCYRAFLLHIGNGGISYQNSAAGPGYGIFPFGENVDEFVYSNPENCLSQDCFIYPKMSDEFWEESIKNIEENDDISEEDFEAELGRIFAGILPLGTEGCTYYYGLVLNGKFKGRVVNVDLDRQKPFFAFESNFLDWYERWLDGITAETVIDEKDLFNYTLGGSTAHILDVFVTAEDEETKLECLQGLLKKKKIDSQTLDILEKEYSLSADKIQKKLLQILVKFDYNRAYPYLIDWVQKDLLSVFQFVYWYAKDRSLDWLDVIKENASKINDDETFNFCTYLLKETGTDYSSVIISFTSHKNAAIRVTAFFALGQLKNKVDYLETFILGLNDEANRVVHITLQALEGINNKKLLQHYKNIAVRFPKEQDYILINLNHRLKAFGLTNETIKEIDPDNY
ncbi:SMI1/KNR4 family protein [Flavobacterium sp. 22076]|uniref:SMI1/KNR4 family protein n=1 Tax=unclassified Flavobacterium TaxID=196869 RepID=UPI003F86DFBC